MNARTREGHTISNPKFGVYLHPCKSKTAGSRNDALRERACSQVRYEVDLAERHVTLVECRFSWRPEYGPEWTRFPVVHFHYAAGRREWPICWRDRNLKFHRYDLVEPSRRIAELLDAVENDRSGFLWG